MRFISAFFISVVVFQSCQQKVDIKGELKVWHKVTLLFEGPNTAERSDPNPFTDYRLEATFTNGNRKMIVPGHFAADGKSAFTSATEGNKWRVYFSPDTIGNWKYQISFRKGDGISVSKDQGESAGFMDGHSGSFKISPSNKTGKDLRSKGKLRYVGEHYPQFTGNKEYFIKCGADAPENILAYYEFDATPNVGGRLKKWEVHQQDFNEDDSLYLWGKQRTKGRSILGAVNYLSGKGMNAFSFLTFNVDGDDRNVFPYLLDVEQEAYQEEANNKDSVNLWERAVMHNRFDISKMDQWEQVFTYADLKGMFLHFKIQETENDHKMDGGQLGSERKLYIRELISRFGHHMALNWNLGEENTQSIDQIKEMATYFNENDPYKSSVVVHTYPWQHDEIYQPLLGDGSKVMGPSIQTKNTDFSLVHSTTVEWVNNSNKSGKKWLVAIDEPGDAGHSLLPDAEDPKHDNARVNGLWGALMGGAYGTEWYFGYKHAHSDLTCESWRSRDLFWNQGKIAIDFFKNNQLPLTEMYPLDSLTEGENDYVFAKPGKVYLIYSNYGDPVEMSLPDSNFTYEWYDPKTGSLVTGDKLVSPFLKLQCPSKQDWLLYVVEEE